MEKNDSLKSVNDTILVMAILYVITQFTGNALAMSSYGFDLSMTLFSIVLAAFTFGLVFSFRSHRKNITKSLMGATLAVLLCFNIESGSAFLVQLEGLVWYVQDYPEYAFFYLVEVLIFADVAALNVSHYAVNAKRESSPDKIKLSGVLFWIYVALTVLATMCIPMFCEETAEAVGDCLGSIADIFPMGVVFAIDSAMEEFREKREAAGWTKETGYPDKKPGGPEA